MEILGRSDLTRNPQGGLIDAAADGSFTRNGEGVSVQDMASEIKKAAKTVAIQWPGVVEADDLEQDIYLHLLERPGSVEKLLTEFAGKDRLNAIIAIGHQIASKERLDYEVFSGNFRYSVDEVKRMIEKGGLRGNSSKNAANQDLNEGLERLKKSNHEYVEALWNKYVLNQTPTSGHDITRVSRALEALTTEMNRSFKSTRHTDGPGSRKPVSATAAHYRSKKNWDDESQEAVNRLMAQARVSGR